MLSISATSKPGQTQAVRQKAADSLTISSISGPTEASYLFADTSEAIYLSKFTDSRISFVNQIPAELLGKLIKLLRKTMLSCMQEQN